jgi:hypothetical protein
MNQPKKLPATAFLITGTVLIALTVLVITFSLVFSAIAGKKAADPNSGTQAAAAPKTSGWYYFSDTGIHPADNPGSIPARNFVPWTEAVRVSDAAIVDGTPSFLINRLGLMTSGTAGGSPAMHTDSLFSSATAAGILKTQGTTAVRLYRNSFFAEKSAASPGESICLARYEPASGGFTALLSAADLGLPKDAQCVSLDRTGTAWYASFKSEAGGKVDFIYLTFETLPARDSAGKVDASGVRKISMDAFQKAVSPASVTDAPDGVRNILAKLPDTLVYTVKLYSDATQSTQTYARRGEGTALDGTAFVSPSSSAILFSDGTFYYGPNGDSGDIRTIQLPALSRGYVYTSFLISGTSLIAAWEEQRFFETGRAGILVTTIPNGV